jgi:hypothetical protein
VPSLCSSLVSLFLTMRFPFITPQQDRRCDLTSFWLRHDAQRKSRMRSRPSRHSTRPFVRMPRSCVRRDVDFKTVSYEPEVDAAETEERADEHPTEVDI